MPKAMTPFQEAVLRAVRMIPAGQVASYGQVAAYIGSPRAARQVGWTLRSLEGTPDFPWWRVINNAGLITIKGNVHNSAVTQKEFLRSEGVEVDDEYRIDIERYRYRASPDELAALPLDPDYMQRISSKYIA